MPKTTNLTDEEIGLGSGLSDADIGLGPETAVAQTRTGDGYIHLTKSQQSALEREGEAAWKAQQKTGFMEGLGEGFLSPMKAAARGPGLAVLSHDTLRDHLLDEYAKATHKPEVTPGGRLGEFVGGLAGTVAQALPVGRAFGAPGLMAQFGSQGAYDAFLRAGMRALSEGKTPDEAADIGRSASLGGAEVGAVLGAIIPGGAGGGLGEAVKTGLKLGGVAGVGRFAQNLLERGLGLKTPVTQDVIPEAATMAAFPVGSRLLGMGLSRLVPPPLPPEAPRGRLALPQRTGPIVTPPPAEAPSMAGIEEQLRTAASVAPRELPAFAPRALPERTGPIVTAPPEVKPTFKPPQTLAEVEELLREAPSRPELVRQLDFQKARAELVALEQAQAAAGAKPLTENQMRLIAPSLMEALGARPYEKSRRKPQPVIDVEEIKPSEEPPTGEAGVPAGQPPKPPAPPEKGAPDATQKRQVEGDVLSERERTEAQRIPPEAGVSDSLQPAATEPAPAAPTPEGPPKPGVLLRPEEKPAEPPIQPPSKTAEGKGDAVQRAQSSVDTFRRLVLNPARQAAQTAKGKAAKAKAVTALRDANAVDAVLRDLFNDKTISESDLEARVKSIVGDELAKGQIPIEGKPSAVATPPPEPTTQPTPPPAAETGEKGPGMEGRRRKTLKEIREQNKLGGQAGFVNLSPIVDYIDRIRRDMQTAAKTFNVRAAMTTLYDAANNKADQYANEVGNGVKNMMLRAAGMPVEVKAGVLTPWKKPDELQRNALTVGVESLSDALPGSGEEGLTGPDRMRVQRQKLSNWTAPNPSLAEWKTKALSSLDYAINNWTTLEPVVRRYQHEMALEHQTENLEGIDTLYRPGYVLHRQDLTGISDFDFLSSRGGTASADFLKVRKHPTYIDSIMAGVTPESMDAIALMKTRLRVGQRKINQKQWVEGLASIQDKTSGKPVMTMPSFQVRADGSKKLVPPDPDYSLIRLGYEDYAIHKGYEGVVESLQRPSFFASSLAGRSIMKSVGTTKHIVLAFDTFHLGRLALWSSIIQGRPAEFKKGLVLLDYSAREIQDMARRGEIPKEYTADLLENKRRMELATRTGYNMARIQDALWQDWTQKIPVTGAFNKWLFGEFQRGAMVQSWLAEFARQRRQSPQLSELEVARTVSRELNTRFGNLQNQGWFRSKTAQDAARLTFLAPQWNEGLIKSEVFGATGAAKSAYDLATKNRLAVSALTRSAGILFLAQLAANQLINFITRGHSTMDNPEDGPDAKLSAYIPDYVGDGPGLFISPFGLPAETAHLIYKRFEKSKEFDEALRQYARTRLGTLARPAMMAWTKTDMFGRAIRSEDLWKEVLKAAVPAPISGSAAFQAGRQVLTGEKAEQFPGQFQRQALASVGVKTEGAPTAVQQISNLAQDWNKQRGVREAAKFYQSDYGDLDRFLRVGNIQDAAKELEDIRTKHADDQIAKRYKLLPQSKFTHSSTDNEARFYSALTDDQKASYIRARQERMELAKRFWELWAKRPAKTLATQ